MRVLVIEDDRALRDEIGAHLARRGAVADLAADAEEGLYYATEFTPDVAIIDLGLPGLSGLDLIRRLRADGASFPILILTARSRWQDKVEGLNNGADDYLVKPFHPEELAARLEALVRRAAGWADPVLRCGDVALDQRTQAVTVAGRGVELTSFEYRVLEHLMLHAGQVVSKNELVERLYAQDFERDSNTVEVFVARLRRKLDPDGGLHLIETLRGRGYRLTCSEPREAAPPVG